MNSRERVLAALSRKEPDRVPMDFGSSTDSSIVVEGYQRLKEHFGLIEEDTIISRMMRSVKVNEKILDELQIDTRGLFPNSKVLILQDENGYIDEWGVRRVQLPGSLYYDQLSYPLSGEISKSAILKYPWPEPDAAYRTAGLKEELKRIRSEKEVAVVLNLPTICVHISQYLRGFEDWFLDFSIDERLLGLLMDSVLEVTQTIASLLLKEMGREVDVVMTADDLGHQRGLMVSADTYRKIIKPRHRRFFDRIHALSPAKILFHSCGSIGEIIGDLVDLGVDVINPVQVSAENMQTKELKRKWGDRMSFWGAIDTHRVLPYGNRSEVEQEVERRIEDLGTGGGYVLCAVHNIQPDVPAENIIAMYKHAREYKMVK
jgi:uroporphyrinogen decarboxylase